MFCGGGGGSRPGWFSGSPGRGYWLNDGGQIRWCGGDGGLATTATKTGAISQRPTAFNTESGGGNSHAQLLRSREPGEVVGEQNVILGLIFQEVEDSATAKILYGEVCAKHFNGDGVAQATAHAAVTVPEVTKAALDQVRLVIIVGGGIGVDAVTTIVGHNIYLIDVGTPDGEAGLV